jgi:signal transduction histidine kinase
MDSDLLEQILINLVSNVEKYAASGKVLRISSSVKQDVLTIEVSDEGKSIPARFRSRIFQPFFRMDNANTSPSGTGLGLTIARKAAMRHGGNLELLASESGCRFRLTMKVKLVMHAPESLKA